MRLLQFVLILGMIWSFYYFQRLEDAHSSVLVDLLELLVVLDGVSPGDSEAIDICLLLYV